MQHRLTAGSKRRAKGTPLMTKSVNRRTVLLGGAVVGVGAAASACGGGGGTPLAGARTANGIGGAEPPATSSTAPGTLGPTSGVPVGGGAIYTSQKVVVTQPVAGTYKAFSAVCTHQGCLVSEVKPSGILCNCHGSTYSIKDGSVLAGPAPAPLKEEHVTESGGTLTLG